MEKNWNSVIITEMQIHTLRWDFSLIGVATIKSMTTFCWWGCQERGEFIMYCLWAHFCRQVCQHLTNYNCIYILPINSASKNLLWGYTSNNIKIHVCKFTYNVAPYVVYNCNWKQPKHKCMTAVEQFCPSTQWNDVHL